MVFNWFRRQYSSDSDQPQEEPAPQPPESPEETPAEAPPVVAEDYLSWAKAAYKNIQQQKLQQETVEETGSPEEGPVVSEQVEASPPVAEGPASEPIEPPVTEEITPPETVEPPVAEVPPLETVEPPAPETVPPPAEPAVTPVDALADADLEPAPLTAPLPEITPEIAEPVAPLPFWAASEAERQARIERLKETAIEVSEPERPVTEAPVAEFPDLAFDEGFLWSAEILASQGRRPDQISIEEITWLQKLRRGLERTRRSLINQLKAIVGQGPLNQEAVTEIEDLLLQADAGVEATDIIINALQQKLKEDVLPPEQGIAYLKQLLRDLLDAPCKENAQGNPAYSLTFAPEKETLNIWMIVGVNGAGKTTTIGKLAHIAQKSGYKCLIAAADTFRAAAVEQVRIWAQRSGVEVISNPGKNTDPAAVVFDAITAAQARGTELLIVDTAGRLQNKKNLMDELSKIRRIVDKKAPGVIVESLLVLDATLGQNGLRQAEVFSEAAQLSGVVLTKLDGTAKGGVALAVVQQLGLPIRFIGVGESIEDLRPFSSYEFVEALLSS